VSDLNTENIFGAVLLRLKAISRCASDPNALPGGRETRPEARQRKASNRIPEASPRPDPPLRRRYLLVPRNFRSGRDWRSRLKQTGDSQMTRTQKNQRPHGVFVVEGDKAFC